MGNLSEETLAGVVRNLYLSRYSGILHLSREDIKKRIYFKKGSMIFANSDIDNDRLGEFLIRNKKITRDDFENASKVMKEKGIRFGKAVVELGVMTAEEMEIWVVKQIEAIIYTLFAWDSGTHRFEHHQAPVDEDIILNLSTADIILEGTRRTNDFEAILRALGDPRRVLRHSENPLLLYQKISLNPQEGFVLSRVDGASTVTDIAALSPLDEEETLRCIYGLVSSGVLELEGKGAPAPRIKPEKAKVEIPKPEAAPLEPETKPKAEREGPTPEEQAIKDDILAKHASLETANLFELLGINVTASDPEVKRAYYAMAKKYHPDRHHSLHLRDVHGLLEELFVKITNAYQTLSNKIERSRYCSSLPTESPPDEAKSGSAPTTTKESEKKKSGPTPSEKTAEIRYREGKRYFTEMAYFDAIQCLREAVRLNPNKTAYRKLLANSLAKNPHWLKEAEEHLQKVVEMDQFDVESYVSLGEIYEKSGMVTRAVKMFQIALDFDPNNETAREKLQGKKKGSIEGIKTLFGKKDEKEQ